MNWAKPMTIDRWIVDAAESAADKPAIIFGDEILTYSEMVMRIDARFNSLIGFGIKRGDRVAWYGLNNPEVFVLLFACARIGAILVPLNWRLAAAEVAGIVADCEPKLVLHDQQFAERSGNLANVSCYGFDIALPVFQEPQSHSEATTDDAILLVYTSGSTGLPKGAILTQKSLICNAGMSVEAHEMTSEDRVLNVLPLFHVGGLNILPTPAFSVGATVVLHQSFDPELACEELQKVTLGIVVPTVLQAIMSTKLWENANLSRLRGLSIGSTDVPVSLINAVHDRGVPMIQVYGATETGPFAIYQTLSEAMTTVGSIGRGGSGCEIRLVTDGVDVSVGTPGEIWVKGDNVLREYWRDEALTGQLLQDGWLRTGDVATLDESGLYWFTDRIKHVIISGGENIYPTEIERLLRDVAGVTEVTVVGCPDEKWGEIPVAVVVSENGLKPDDILSALNGRLARYKHPKKVFFVDALPRNATGKVIAADVREMVLTL